MKHRRLVPVLAALGSAVVAAGRPAASQAVEEQFAIASGDAVADGSPGPGAGNIESGGAQDAYTFAADAGDEAIFDVLAGSAGEFRMQLEAPGGEILFDGLYVDRREILPEGGTYTLRVRGATETTVGTYSFRLLLAPAAEDFAIAIGDTVSEGVPAAGAGNIEGPGAVDVYRFDGGAGQGVVFDLLAGNNVFLGWRLEAPDGTELFDGFVRDRQVTLPQTGTYTLTVAGNGIDDSGAYSFQLLEVPAAVDEFTVGFGDTVADGLPGPGAGNIEAPGAVDRYRFEAAAGQGAVFDVLAGSPNDVRWSLTAPDGSTVFDSLYVDQQATLTQPGTYTLTVTGLLIASTGTYSFQLLEVPAAVDEFTVGFGDTVADGLPGPGAGNIEAPGAVDRYRFEAAAGQGAVFDVLTGSPNDVRWSLTAPDGSTVFDSLYVDQQATLTQPGTYTLTVTGLLIASTGTYSFQLLEAPANTAPVATDDEAQTDEGVAVTVDVLANDSDPDGHALAVDTVSDPANGTATTNGADVTYTPDPGFVGVDTFTYTVTDGRGGSDEAAIIVTVHAVPPPNRAPTITSPGDQTSVEGDGVTLAIAANDPDGDDLAYSATGQPDGLAIDPASGQIAGTVASGAASDSPYDVEVTVTDPDGVTATTQFQWTVTPPDTDTLAVDIAIWPFCIHNNGHGVIPVVIYANADLSAAAIDLSSIRLEGMPVARLGPWHLAVKIDLNHDHLSDLVVLIDDVAGAIPAEATEATLTARLTDGTPIAGTDTICVRR